VGHRPGVARAGRAGRSLGPTTSSGSPGRSPRGTQLPAPTLAAVRRRGGSRRLRAHRGVTGAAVRRGRALAPGCWLTPSGHDTPSAILLPTTAGAHSEFRTRHRFRPWSVHSPAATGRRVRQRLTWQLPLGGDRRLKSTSTGTTSHRRGHPAEPEPAKFWRRLNSNGYSRVTIGAHCRRGRHLRGRNTALLTFLWVPVHDR
jgi:hypothetical protein